MLCKPVLGLLLSQLAFSYGVSSDERLVAEASPSASKASSKALDDDFKDAFGVLQTKLRSMEKRMELYEAALLTADIDADLKKQLKSAFELRSIEDDVLQNKEDIVDLRVNDGRHDMLLSQEMNQINYINNTIIPSLDHKLDVNVEELHQYDSFIDSTRPPIGSIVAWIPAYSAKAEIPSGWQRCDGTDILSGPLKGMKTPDLNGARRFLRGGADEAAGGVEEDSVQDHLHQDPGHSHTDAGHTHTDNGHSHYEDASGDGHFPVYMGSDEAHHEDVVCTRYVDKLGGCGGYFVKWNTWTTDSGKASITTNAASIQASQTGIGAMSSGRVGEETRPKNMIVVYIMRVL